MNPSWIFNMLIHQAASSDDTKFNAPINQLGDFPINVCGRFKYDFFRSLVKTKTSIKRAGRKKFSGRRELPLDCFIHAVHQITASVASISLIIKWKNNNRKNIVVDKVFVKSRSLRTFYYFLIYFLSIYLFSMLFRSQKGYLLTVCRPWPWSVVPN